MATYPALVSPYAPGPNRMNDAFRIADLIRQQGYSAAAQKGRRGAMVADLVTGAGGMMLGAMQRRDDAREASDIATMINSGNADLGSIIKRVGVEKAKTLVPMIEAHLTRLQAIEDRKQALADKQLAASEKANTRGMWQMSMDALGQPGADKYKIQQQFAGQTGETLPLKDLLPDPKEARDLKDEEELAAHVEAINGGANAEAMNRNLLARTGGRVSIPVNMMPKVPEPVKPAALGTFEDYVERYAKARNLDPKNLSDKHIEEARKLYQQADDRPRVTVNNGPSAYQEFGMTERLAGVWTKAVAPVREMERQLRVMRVGLSQMNGADKVGGSQAIINTFGKILDPTSVVRESEYARTAAGQSLIDRLQGLYDTAKSGGAYVDPAVLKGMVETAEGFLKSMDDWKSGTRRRIEAQARDYKLNPANIFDDVLMGDDGGTVTLWNRQGQELKVPAAEVDQALRDGALRQKPAGR